MGKTMAKGVYRYRTVQHQKQGTEWNFSNNEQTSSRLVEKDNFVRWHPTHAAAATGMVALPFRLARDWENLCWLQVTTCGGVTYHCLDRWSEGDKWKRCMLRGSLCKFRSSGSCWSSWLILLVTWHRLPKDSFTSTVILNSSLRKSVRYHASPSYLKLWRRTFIALLNAC